MPVFQDDVGEDLADRPTVSTSEPWYASAWELVFRYSEDVAAFFGIGIDNTQLAPCL
jgi:hypothetical protein